MKRNNHSDLDIFHHDLIKVSVITRVNISTIMEKILSYIRYHHNESHVHVRQFGCKSNLVMMADIHTIHSILNMSDPITFHTHISYFFLIIAVMVAAISGRLVHAAIIVAQIAHCDTHKLSAINTAEATITSEDITNNPILVIILVILSKIQFSCSFLLFFFLLNNERKNKSRTTHMNMIEYADNQNLILNQF